MEQNISWFICIPFVVLLLLIAVMPLLLPHFWEKNRNKAVVAAVISLPILIYLLRSYPHELLGTFTDYISFIILLASLFVVSGGIVVNGDLRATPLTNTVIMLLGAILANLVGTTGASMLLIRPLLKTIRQRKHAAHIPVFFIFVVSNIGGCLTPLGDPPLFLGFLRGVPFTWTLSLFPIWLTALGLVLTIFYIWDSVSYRKEQDIRRDPTVVAAPLRISGSLNFIFLVLIIAAVSCQAPSPYREIVMAAAIGLSLWFTPQSLRAQNQFTFGPISEVAILFAGIFITMAPLLMLLDRQGASLGITKPWQFFWLSGILSSFLDNTPTYLTFSSLAVSVTKSLKLAGPVVAGINVDLLRAISCGAVFMGANTYIGNGPNFMVKSIAEEQGVKVPNFFSFMLYSGSVLMPVFLLITWLFFRAG
jgi:Na+/H+ antiporter NhaD/arsenite permease-like protein